jgi:hypothetical protein
LLPLSSTHHLPSRMLACLSRRVFIKAPPSTY